jgi:hypothetical protein
VGCRGARLTLRAQPRQRGALFLAVRVIRNFSIIADTLGGQAARRGRTPLIGTKKNAKRAFHRGCRVRTAVRCPGFRNLPMPYDRQTGAGMAR